MSSDEFNLGFDKERLSHGWNLVRSSEERLYNDNRDLLELLDKSETECVMLRALNKQLVEENSSLRQGKQM